MNAKIEAQKIEITTRTVLKTIILLIALYFLWEMRAVIFMLFFAFILYSAFNPIVSRMQKNNIPRWAAIAFIYVALFIVISIIMVLGANALITQFQSLASDLDGIIFSFLDAIEKVFPWLQGNIDKQQFVNDLQSEGVTQSILSTKNISSAVGVVSSVSSAALTVFVVIMTSIYMLAREDKFYKGIIQIFFKKYEDTLTPLMQKVETNLGAWFSGQLLLMIIIGVVTWIGVMIPGLFIDTYTVDEYALPIALIAGLLEAVPTLGPTLTVVLASIIAIGSGDVTTAESSVITLAQAAYMVILGTVIQNLEAVVLVPGVMKRAVGVDPIVTILGIIGALSMFGIVGAILVIPVIATVQIVVEFYRENTKASDSRNIKV